MRNLLILLFLIIYNTSLSQTYTHSSTVYYNVVNDSIPNWINEPQRVDYDISFVNYELYLKVITMNAEDSYFILYDTLYSSNTFTKYLAYDYKEMECEVSIGKSFDTNQMYLLIQYPDMGWCCILDK